MGILFLSFMPALPSTYSIQLDIEFIQVGLYILAGEMFLYGIYLVLFGFYLHILHTRGISNNRFLTIATISLFMLGTSHFALLAADALGIESEDSTAEIFSALNAAANGVYVTSNVIADTIFLFRCYAIWNFERKMIIIPALYIIAVAFFGYLNLVQSIMDVENVASDSHLSRDGLTFLLSVLPSLVATVMLMCLSAGRIWGLAHAARRVMGRKIAGRYYTVCAMILESGALYFAGGMAYIFLIGPYSTDFQSGGVLGQLVGIAPTIIAVRVGLGKSVESVDSFIEVQPRSARAPLQVPSARPVHSNEERILYLRPQTDPEIGKVEA
ncbi:hypothetical protein DFH07DRAFT_990507 [Mycena maculata]|uniref:Uncharacterized protein n=1 Tax=Mycena maculata TaxID=230809 RepID=A0AAD7I1K1_9AGAR|nr:hypothetical protein DFH07DRAFT_990507 [Mycena maculata]